MSKYLIEDKFFVAGQMDAQGHEAEKWKIGSGGPVLAMSKRLLDEARVLLAELEAENTRLRAQLESQARESVAFVERIAKATSKEKI
jgi:hypothetical protein